MNHEPEPNVFAAMVCSALLVIIGVASGIALVKLIDLIEWVMR